MKILAKKTITSGLGLGQRNRIMLSTKCSYTIDVKMKPEFFDNGSLRISRDFYGLLSTGIINENYTFSRKVLSENVKNNIIELVWDVLKDTAGVLIWEDSIIVEAGHTYRFKGWVKVLFDEYNTGEVDLRLEEDEFQDCIKLR